MADDTHRTLGRNFRTPAHPDMLWAMGRALYNFLSLEENVTAIFYDSGASDLSITRGKMAGEKEKALRDLAALYRAASNGAGVADSIDQAADAFGAVRSKVRNELLHAHPFTAGYDDDGTYLPGLGYTAGDGQSWKTIATSADDVLDLATKVEAAIDPLSKARSEVTALPLSALIP